VLLHSDGYYVNAGATMRLYVRQSDVRQRLPDLVLGLISAASVGRRAPEMQDRVASPRTPGFGARVQRTG
jgi:hypothetical protein